MADFKIVDTHTHICDSSFDADRGEVLKRAAQAGVIAIIAVGENISDARRNIELADEHPMIRPAAGLYPTILDLDQAEEMGAFIRKERSRQKQKLLKHLPLSCLLVETDSPVLGPEPKVRNEPTNVNISIKAISELKDIAEEAVIEAIWENTLRLYGKIATDLN